MDRELVGHVLQLLGDVRALWLPAKAGTTLTDKSRNARVLTWSEDVSAFDTLPAELGSGYAVVFNGTDEEGDSPDAADLSLGDGASDQPLSLFGVVKPAVNNAAMAIVTKVDLTTASTKREWELSLDSSGLPFVRLHDESAGSYIGRKDATAAGTSWTALAMTYDGSGAAAGIRLYKDGARVDDTDDSSGSYTAMENTTSLVRVGFRKGASADEQFWNGQIALTAVVGKELSQDEVWALKEAVNGYYGLSL